MVVLQPLVRPSCAFIGNNLCMRAPLLDEIHCKGVEEILRVGHSSVDQVFVVFDTLIGIDDNYGAWRWRYSRRLPFPNARGTIATLTIPAMNGWIEQELTRRAFRTSQVDRREALSIIRSACKQLDAF